MTVGHRGPTPAIAYKEARHASGADSGVNAMSRARIKQCLLASVLPLILIACGSSMPEASTSEASTASASSPEPSSEQYAASTPSTQSALTSARERVGKTRAEALPPGDCARLGKASLRRQRTR